MGQAKHRKAEIDALKAKKPREYSILAIRHCEDGQTEFAYFGGASYHKPKNDKKALLRHICLNDWGHNPPAGHIVDYLWQTTTFNMFGDQPGVESFVINFYEVDDERSAIAGEKVYSCRHILGGSADHARVTAENLKNDLSKTGRYSIKENHSVNC